MNLRLKRPNKKRAVSPAPLLAERAKALFRYKLALKLDNSNITMVRPRICRKVRFNPKITYFKPQGVPMRHLEVMELTTEEVEALRLKNIKDLDQEEAAKKMNTSQSTFQRILTSAYKKTSEAIIKGKAIKIIKDN